VADPGTQAGDAGNDSILHTGNEDTLCKTRVYWQLGKSLHKPCCGTEDKAFALMIAVGLAA